MRISSFCLLHLLPTFVSAANLRNHNVQSDEDPPLLSEQLTMNDVDNDVRIVGGEKASFDEFPWFAYSGGGCGASLIHKQILLTAAHCEGAAFVEGTNVFFGATKIDGSDATTRRSVAKTLTHPNWDMATLQNDFMLVKLTKPIHNIAPIELNTDAAIPANGQILTAMGFGDTVENSGEGSSNLLKVDLVSTGHDACVKSHLSLNEIFESNMVCAGSPDPNVDGKDSCQGDSGGPLITVDGKQVGVVSFGEGCGRANIPGIYSRVSGAMEFINAGLCSLTTEDHPEFCPDTEPTSDDSTVPTVPVGGTSTVKIIVQYDGNPRETAWELSQNGGNVHYSFPNDSSTLPAELQNKLMSYVFDEIPAGEYTFTIYDSASNGLSGTDAFPQLGFFVIQQHVNVENDDGDGDNDKEILAAGDHVFSGSKSVSFTVVASS